MSPTLLLYATLIITGLVVAVLVVYLLGIIIALRKGANHLAVLAEGLQKIANDTKPLTDHTGTIHDALKKLLQGLVSVDDHLVDIAKVFKLI